MPSGKNWEGANGAENTLKERSYGPETGVNVAPRGAFWMGISRPKRSPISKLLVIIEPLDGDGEGGNVISRPSMEVRNDFALGE